MSAGWCAHVRSKTVVQSTMLTAQHTGPTMLSRAPVQEQQTDTTLRLVVQWRARALQMPQP